MKEANLETSNKSEKVQYLREFGSRTGRLCSALTVLVGEHTAAGAEGGISLCREVMMDSGGKAVQG